MFRRRSRHDEPAYANATAALHSHSSREVYGLHGSWRRGPSAACARRTRRCGGRRGRRRQATGDKVARFAADGGSPTVLAEPATQQNLAILLDGHCMDTSVCVRIEGVCQTGRGIEPGNAIAWLSADDRETAAHNDLPVRLHRNRTDAAV